jgi:RHS repeat-associated protein
MTAEYDGANTLVAGYIGLPTVDQQLEMTRGGQRYFYLRDGSNSVVALTDLAGSTAATYSYDAFGVPGTSTGSVTNPLRYTGREYDSSSGLYFYRARYYDPNSGRFLSEDPIRHLNPYPYAANDPVDFNDPSGALLIEYFALAADQFHRASAIGTFAACLGNLLMTGLKDFRGLSSEEISRSLAYSLRTLAIGLLDNPFVDAAFGPHDFLHEAAAAGNIGGTIGQAANELFTISGADYLVLWDIHGFVRTKGGVRAVPGGPRILVVESQRVYWKPFPGAGLFGSVVGTGLGAGLDAHDFLTVLLDPNHTVCKPE